MPDSVITRLLDHWWDYRTTAHQRRARRAQRRANLRPIRLPADISISVDGYPLCNCGHPANPHRHYRDGNDCSMCTCRTYTARRLP